MPNEQVTLSARGRWLVALGMCAFGTVIALSTFDIGPLGTGDINGPAWLGMAAGGTIIAGGLAFLSGQRRPVVTGLLGIVALLGLAAIGNWIAFGVGARSCGASIFVWAGEMQGLGCRIPFGIGALITNAIVVMSIVVLVQTALGGPPRLARVRRGAEVLVFLSLAPILAPIFLVMIAGMFISAVKTRLTTGKWPRNEKFIARQRAKLNKNP